VRVVTPADPLTYFEAPLASAVPVSTSSSSSSPPPPPSPDDDHQQPGGVSADEHAVTPEVQDIANALRADIVAAARRTGWNGSLAHCDVVSFKTQVRTLV
jgi:hypothetical protein